MATRSTRGMRTLLTGASSGIGWAMAKELARGGARLVVNARREDRLNQLVEELRRDGAEAHAVVGDVVSPEVRKQLLEEMRTKLGGLDCLINNAGMGGIGDFSLADEARLRRIMEVNFFAPLELIRSALPLLRVGNKPAIMNVASVLGHVAVPKKSEYCASKFALHGFTDSLRDELAKEGIDVLLLCPSTTDTEFFDAAIGDKRELTWLQKGQSPEAVAKAAVRCISRGKPEIILTIGGKALVWMDRLASNLTHYLVRKYT